MEDLSEYACISEVKFLHYEYLHGIKTPSFSNVGNLVCCMHSWFQWGIHTSEVECDGHCTYIVHCTSVNLGAKATTLHVC